MITKQVYLVILSFIGLSVEGEVILKLLLWQRRVQNLEKDPMPLVCEQFA